LRSRQRALLKRPDLSKVINLHVDPHSYWIYTNTPPDNERLIAAAGGGEQRDALGAVAAHLKAGSNANLKGDA
jgi:hypothetical protein